MLIALVTVHRLEIHKMNLKNSANQVVDFLGV